MLSCAMQTLYGIGQFLWYGERSEFLINYLLDIVNTNVNGYNIAKELFLRKQVKDMDALEKEEMYTIEDIYSLPDGERAELIDGKIYYMDPPNTKHQRLISELHYQIKDYMKQRSGECEVFPAPFAVYLNENDKNYVEPDLSVIYDKSKITDEGCNGAPDWVIEIVSPSSRKMDYYTKLFKYRTARVREYWIVDPDKQITIVYDFGHDNMEEYSFNKEIPVGVYEGLSIKIE